MQTAMVTRIVEKIPTVKSYCFTSGFKVTMHDDLISKPLEWKKPLFIFVNSMSDLFHEDIPASFIRSFFHTMGQAHWHTFQILTKRSERLSSLSGDLPWPDNVWMGVTVEDADNLHRIDDLVSRPAKLKFISFEPLLGSVGNANLSGIDWVIAGGESGISCRPMETEWVLEIKKSCESYGVPFFIKQWGGRNKKRSGRLLERRYWDEYPAIIDSKLSYA